MKNLFEQASSYWVRYDRYELKEGMDGVLYVTAAPDATPEVYNPLENPEQLVLDALNVGLLSMGRKSEEVIRQGMIRMKYMCLPYFLCGIMEVGSGLLRGMGRSMTSMAVAILGVCGIRLVWIFTVFAYFRTLEVLYLSYVVTWVITATTHFTFGLLAVRKLKRQAEQNFEEQGNALQNSIQN